MQRPIHSPPPKPVIGTKEYSQWHRTQGRIHGGWKQATQKNIQRAQRSMRFSQIVWPIVLLIGWSVLLSDYVDLFQIPINIALSALLALSIGVIVVHEIRYRRYVRIEQEIIHAKQHKRKHYRYQNRKTEKFAYRKPVLATVGMVRKKIYILRAILFFGIVLLCSIIIVEYFYPVDGFRQGGYALLFVFLGLPMFFRLITLRECLRIRREIQEAEKRGGKYAWHMLDGNFFEGNIDLHAPRI